MRADSTQTATLGQLALGPRWAEEEQLRIAFDNLTGALAASLISACVLVLLLWPVVDNEGLIIWLGATAVIAISRLVLQQQFERREPRKTTFARWKRAFVGSVFLSGCVWGALPAFLFPFESLQHQAFVAMVLSGIAAGAVTAYAPLPGAFPAFALPMLTPFAIQVFQVDNGSGPMVTLLVAAFALSMLRSARHSRRNVLDLLRMQMKNAELARELHHRATHDSLVNLVNQGEFRRRLERLTRSGRRHSDDYSVIFIDLDSFKEVNDTGGHAAGDRVLQGVAEIIRRNTRACDTAARVGGDEFAAILEGCPHGRATEIAERIRTEIENFRLEHDGRYFAVRASIGVAYGKIGEHSAANMLKAADAACYSAKEQGRNLVRENAAGGCFDSSDRFELTQALTAQPRLREA